MADDELYTGGEDLAEADDSRDDSSDDGGSSSAPALTKEQVFPALLSALSSQESAGNYKAQNGRTGASGKYQIMPKNIRQWSKDILGYEVTPEQFRKDPNLQEQIARPKLSEYFDGALTLSGGDPLQAAQLVANKWYTGKYIPDNDGTRPAKNEPSPAEYRNQFAQRLGYHLGVAIPGVEGAIVQRAPQFQSAPIVQRSKPFTLESVFEPPEPIQPQQQPPQQANDFDKNFDTILSANDESKFQDWKAKYAPNDSGGDYDLRGAYKAGLTPDPQTGHWPDTFKKPNHPTFSDESRYAPYGNPGHWDGDTFVPPSKASVTSPVSAVAPDVMARFKALADQQDQINAQKKTAPASAPSSVKPQDPQTAAYDYALRNGIQTPVADAIGPNLLGPKPGTEGLRTVSESTTQKPRLTPEMSASLGATRDAIAQRQAASMGTPVRGYSGVYRPYVAPDGTKGAVLTSPETEDKIEDKREEQIKQTQDVALKSLGSALGNGPAGALASLAGNSQVVKDVAGATVRAEDMMLGGLPSALAPKAMGALKELTTNPNPTIATLQDIGGQAAGIAASAGAGAFKVAGMGAESLLGRLAVNSPVARMALTFGLESAPREAAKAITGQQTAGEALKNVAEAGISGAALGGGGKLGSALAEQAQAGRVGSALIKGATGAATMSAMDVAQGEAPTLQSAILGGVMEGMGGAHEGAERGNLNMYKRTAIKTLDKDNIIDKSVLAIGKTLGEDATTGFTVGRSDVVDAIKQAIDNGASNPKEFIEGAADILHQKFGGQMDKTEFIDTFGKNLSDALDLKAPAPAQDQTPQTSPEKADLSETPHTAAGGTYVTDEPIIERQIKSGKKRGQTQRGVIAKDLTQEQVESITNRRAVKEGDGFFIPEKYVQRPQVEEGISDRNAPEEQVGTATEPVGNESTPEQAPQGGKAAAPVEVAPEEFPRETSEQEAPSENVGNAQAVASEQETPAAEANLERPAVAVINNAEDVSRHFQEHFGLPKEQADAAAAVADARASSWSERTGKPKEEWYRTRIADITNGRPGENALFQRGRFWKNKGLFNMYEDERVAKAIAHFQRFADARADAWLENRQNEIENEIAQRQAEQKDVGARIAEKEDVVENLQADLEATHDKLRQSIEDAGIPSDWTSDVIANIADTPYFESKMDRSVRPLGSYLPDSKIEAYRNEYERLAQKEIDDWQRSVRWEKETSPDGTSLDDDILKLGPQHAKAAADAAIENRRIAKQLEIENGDLNDLYQEHEDISNALSESSRRDAEKEFDKEEVADKIFADYQQRSDQRLLERREMFQGEKASVEFLKDNRAVIRGLESPDVSSAVHELGHVFRNDLAREGSAAGDLAVAEKELGVKDGKWTTAHEEKFARAFERYLRDGKAPTSALGKVFEQFKGWLKNIYQKIKGSDIDVKLSPELRGVFDRLLSEGEPTNAIETRNEQGNGEREYRGAASGEDVRTDEGEVRGRESEQAVDSDRALEETGVGEKESSVAQGALEEQRVSDEQAPRTITDDVGVARGEETAPLSSEPLSPMASSGELKATIPGAETAVKITTDVAKESLGYIQRAINGLRDIVSDAKRGTFPQARKTIIDPNDLRDRDLHRQTFQYDGEQYRASYVKNADGKPELRFYKGEGKNAKLVIGASDALKQKLIEAAKKELVQNAVMSAQKTAYMLRDVSAQGARQLAIRTVETEHAREFFQKRSAADNVAFISRVMKGHEFTDPMESEAANVIRRVFRDQGQRVMDAAKRVGKDIHFDLRDSFFSLLWDEKSKATLGQVMAGKRPFGGTKYFMNKKVFEDIQEGIDRGLTPKYTNPIDFVMHYVAESEKMIAGFDATKELKDKGYIRVVKSKKNAPAGWERVEGLEKYAKDANGNLVQTGQVYAPSGAAQVLNNYFSKGIDGHFLGKAFKSWMLLNNHLNQLQLSLSGFHATFVTMESIMSRVSLGIREATYGVSHGDSKFFKQGLKKIGTGLAAPRGSDLGRDVKSEWFSPGSTDNILAKELANALMRGGYRGEMPREHQAGKGKIVGSVKETAKNIGREAIKDFKDGNHIAGVIGGLSSYVEAPTRVILEKYVPHMKFMAATEMAKFELEKFAHQHGRSATPEEQRAIAAKIVDVMDDRFGELAYDNLFWNKTFKQTAMAVQRSVGWNYGVLRTILGGSYDTVVNSIRAGGKIAEKVSGGKYKQEVGPEFTQRMSYLAAFPAVAATIGSVINTLATGRLPGQSDDDSGFEATLKDMFFPRTGGIDANGNPARISIPSYANDAYNLLTDALSVVSGAGHMHPFRTIGHKISPGLSLFSDMVLKGSDYYDNKIFSDNVPWYDNALAGAKYVGRQFLPMSATQLVQSLGESKGIFPYLASVGVKPAPPTINRTTMQEFLAERSAAKRSAEGKSEQQSTQTTAARQIESLYRQGKTKEANDLANEKMREGSVSPDAVAAAYRNAHSSAREEQMKNASADDAFTAYFDLASDAERKSLSREMTNKMLSVNLYRLTPESAKGFLDQVNNAEKSGKTSYIDKGALHSFKSGLSGYLKLFENNKLPTINFSPIPKR